MAIGFLVFSLVWAMFGYRRADRFLAATGSNVGGASPAIWGFICLMFGLIGYIVLCIAESSAKKRVTFRPTSRESQYDQQRWTPPTLRPTQEPSPYYTPLPSPADAPSGLGRPNVGGQEFLPRR